MPQEARVAERWEQGMADTEQVRLAAEAYIYGYPLVYDLEEVASSVEGGGSLPFQANPIDRYSIGDRTSGLQPRR
jgi:hypothetical protein